VSRLVGAKPQVRASSRRPGQPGQQPSRSGEKVSYGANPTSCRSPCVDASSNACSGMLRNALQAAVREELVQRKVAKLVQVRGATYEVSRGLNADQARKLRVAAPAEGPLHPRALPQLAARRTSRAALGRR
jgi:hypothetical protein